MTCERVLFKFVENNFEKLQRLIELFNKYFEKIAEFALSEFKTQEEIQYLYSDYSFEVT